MRKIYFIVSFIFLFLITSCNLKTEDELIDEKVSNFLTCLEEEDKEGISNLFAKSKIDESSNFYESLDQLFIYYQGEFLSKLEGGRTKDRDKDGKYQATFYDLAYQIKTSSENYRLAIYWCTEYSTNQDLVGIWSLYIIKENDYNTPNYTYHGDGLLTPGINIAKLYSLNEA